MCLHWGGNPAVERGEEEARAPSSPLSRKKEDKGPPGVPLLRVVLAVIPFVPPPFFSFLSYSPFSPPSYLRPDVCIIVWPDGLIVVSLRSARSPARLPNCVRRSAVRARQFHQESLASSAERLIVVPHVEHRAPKAIFSCGSPHKKSRWLVMGIDQY